MNPDQYDTLIQQHIALLNQNAQMLLALVVLTVGCMVGMVIVAALAAWSVQSANRTTRMQSQAILDGLGEIKVIVQLLARTLARRPDGPDTL